MSLYLSALNRGCVRLFSLPRLSIPLMFTLGLTLAAVLVVLAMANTLFFRPLPDIHKEQELYQVDVNINLVAQMQTTFLAEDKRFSSLKKAFEQAGEWAQIELDESNIQTNGQSVNVTHYSATAKTPEILGLKVLLGHSTSVEQAEQGVWISESLWRRQFAGSNNVLNQVLSLNGKDFPILGVIQDLMSIRSESSDIQALQIWQFKLLTHALAEADSMAFGSVRISLLRSNGSPLPTQEQLHQWYINYLDINLDNPEEVAFIKSKAVVESIVPYREGFLGSSQMLINVLLGVMFSLLLMACLNLLNMFIAHYQQRNKEFAIQLCMGASPTRLRSLVFLENLPMFLLACSIGLLGAAWLFPFLPGLTQGSVPLVDTIELDWGSMAVALLIIVLINIVFSVMCLLHLDKDSLSDSLNSSGKGTPAQHKQGISRVLMVLQLAIACSLMSLAISLAVKSFQDAYQNLGYELPNAWEVSLQYLDNDWQQSLNNYDNYQNSELYQLRQRLAKRLSNALEAPVLDSGSPPLSDFLSVSSYTNEDNQNLFYMNKEWSLGYLETFAIPLLAGSNLDAQDLGSQNILVDLSFAQMHMGTDNWQKVIGQEVQLGREEQDRYRIKGVVGNTVPRPGNEFDLDVPAVYFAKSQGESRLRTLVILDEGEVLDAQQLNSILSDLEPHLGKVSVENLHDRLNEATAFAKLNLYMVLSLAALTLILAAIGVAGLSQMNGAQKRYELAIRMATGASQSGLLWLLLKDAMLMLIMGLVIGILCAVLSYQLITTLVANMPIFSWLTASCVSVVLSFTMLVSVIVPGWLVVRADPMQVLRDL